LLLPLCSIKASVGNGPGGNEAAQFVEMTAGGDVGEHDFVGQYRHEAVPSNRQFLGDPPIGRCEWRQQKKPGRAVMRRPDHACGTDRIFEALGRIAVPADIVINVQCDLPTLDPADIRAALGPLADPAVDIATIAAEIAEAGEPENPNVAEVVDTPADREAARALLGGGSAEQRSTGTLASRPADAKGAP
jgi:hypothetical protein